MYYLILKESNMTIKNGDKVLEFEFFEDANIERIYLQPNFEETILIHEG